MLSTRGIFLITLLVLVCCSVTALATEKVLYYEAGALTANKSEYNHMFDYRGNRQYAIEIGLVNYSEAPSSLSYRGQSSNLKKITIDSLQNYTEAIRLTPVREGKFLIQIKADFLSKQANFTSFDVVIKEIY